ncbi:NHL repeat-containing protein [Williamsia deligens]|uniref:DNA-binding beta-propeller fold protein YncE n=1 Tax=Williamsia deligens TaxID=321325 RepID=A0ABW3GAX8_9NOCA|nr:hypothetical protein [Williamsia deligens]MCP2195235.1 hypothetical protein [Williamsia deligens]
MLAHRRRLSAALLVVVAAAGVLSACGSDSSSQRSDVATTAPQTPLAAPALGTQAPSGTVVPAPASSTIVLDPTGRRVVVLGADRASLAVYSIADPRRPVAQRSIPLPVAVDALGALRNGVVIAAAPDRLLSIDLAAGTVASRQVPVSQPLSLARLTDGRVAIGSAGGDLTVVSAAGDDGRVVRIGGLVRGDELAVHPRAGRDDQVLVLDRAQSSVTAVDVGDGSLGEALRAGDGATNLAVDHYGRFLVTDTRSGDLTAFYGDPIIMRFRYPVAAGPYAVGYDDTRNLAWVATTGDNGLVAFDLASGIPVQRKQSTTVRQADALAVDNSTGVVYLVSARGDGLQAAY